MESINLNAIITDACTNLLQAKINDVTEWQTLMSKLSRNGLSDRVTFHRWSKFQWHRHPVNLNRVQLLENSQLLDAAIEVISDNLLALLKRDLPPTAVVVLSSKFDASMLDLALSELWLNQLTGQRIAQLILQQAIKADLNQLISDHSRNHKFK